MDLDEPAYAIGDTEQNLTSLDRKTGQDWLDPVFYEAYGEELCWHCTLAEVHYSRNCPHLVAKDTVTSSNDSQMMIDQTHAYSTTSDSGGTADYDGDKLIGSGDETMATSWSETSSLDVKHPQTSLTIRRASADHPFQLCSPTSQEISADSMEPLPGGDGKTEMSQHANDAHDVALTLRQIRRLEAEKALFESENCFPTEEELAHIAALAELTVECLRIWFLEHLDVRCILAASGMAESPAMLTPRPVYDPTFPSPEAFVPNTSQAVAEVAQKYIDSSLDKSCASGQTRRAANVRNATAFDLSCPECGANFKNSNRLLRHMSKRYPQTLWYCYLCAILGGEPYIHHRNDKVLEHMLESHGLAHADAVEARNQCLVPAGWYQTAFPASCPFVKPCSATFQSWDEFQAHWLSHFSNRRSSSNPRDDLPGDDVDSDGDNDDDDNNGNGAKSHGKSSKRHHQLQSNTASKNRSSRPNRVQSKTTRRAGDNDASLTSMSAASNCDSNSASNRAIDVWRWLDTVNLPGFPERQPINRQSPGSLIPQTLPYQLLKHCNTSHIWIHGQIGHGTSELLSAAAADSRAYSRPRDILRYFGSFGIPHAQQRLTTSFMLQTPRSNLFIISYSIGPTLRPDDPANAKSESSFVSSAEAVRPMLLPMRQAPRGALEASKVGRRSAGDNGGAVPSSPAHRSTCVVLSCATYQQESRRSRYVSQLKRHLERHKFFYCLKCLNCFESKLEQDNHACSHPIHGGVESSRRDIYQAWCRQARNLRGHHTDAQVNATPRNPDSATIGSPHESKQVSKVGNKNEEMPSTEPLLDLFKHGSRLEEFFRVDRVFQLLRTDCLTPASKMSASFEGTLHQKVRRFVVIQEKDQSALALPISTYGRTDVTEEANKHEHGLLHTGGKRSQISSPALGTMDDKTGTSRHNRSTEECPNSTYTSLAVRTRSNPLSLDNLDLCSRPHLDDRPREDDHHISPANPGVSWNAYARATSAAPTYFKSMSILKGREPPNLIDGPPITYEDASTMRQHQTYLTLGQNETRVLLLSPAANINDELIGRLEVISLASRDKYEALSYSWDDLQRPFSLQLPGMAVNIGHNLNNALRRLRHPTEEKALWIDALCIDQANTMERHQQVNLMYDIYNQAARVLVWLGAEEPSITRCEDLLQRYGEWVVFCFFMAGSEQHASLGSMVSKLQASRSRSRSALHHGALCLPGYGIGDGSGADDDEADHNDE